MKIRDIDNTWRALCRDCDYKGEWGSYNLACDDADGHKTIYHDHFIIRQNQQEVAR